MIAVCVVSSVGFCVMGLRDWDKMVHIAQLALKFVTSV